MNEYVKMLPIWDYKDVMQRMIMYVYIIVE
jgi:hypothetical protein